MAATPVPASAALKEKESVEEATTGLNAAWPLRRRLVTGARESRNHSAWAAARLPAKSAASAVT